MLDRLIDEMGEDLVGLDSGLVAAPLPAARSTSALRRALAARFSRSPPSSPRLRPPCFCPPMQPAALHRPTCSPAPTR
jgi:hypothetical protein